MSDLPPGLQDFGDRLEHAAEREIEQRRRPRRRLRSLGLPVTAALLAAAVGAGAVRLSDGGDREGESIEPERGAGAAALQPAQDPAVVVRSAAADPDGGRPWVVRVYTNAAGRTCVQVGQLRDGRLVQRQRGRYRAMPKSATGVCASDDARGTVIAVRRRGDLTLVFGAGVDSAPVTVGIGDRERRVQPVGLGAFVAVFAGVDAKQRVVVRARVRGRASVHTYG